jgi:hypothetical protein
MMSWFIGSPASRRLRFPRAQRISGSLSEVFSVYCVHDTVLVRPTRDVAGWG